MRGLVLSDAELRAALSGTLDRVTLPEAKAWRRLAPGDRVYVKEAWTEVHPLAVQAGRYSQPGRGGIPGPPPVDYRVVYQIDGPTRRVWHRRDGGHPYRALEPPTDCFCRGRCPFPGVCSDWQVALGKRQGWHPARGCPERVARLFLQILAIEGRTAQVRVQRREALDTHTVGAAA